MNIPESCYIEPDVLLVHKPVGMSSFDVIRKLRPIVNQRKIGHAGTLDPLASGLMIVGIASGTKKMTQYLKLPKVYNAEIFVGTSTTTGDAEGEVLEEKHVSKTDMKQQDLEMLLKNMVGNHILQVPLYSAIKVEGKPLYWYARNNQKPPYIPEKPMNITSVQLLDSYTSGKGYVVKIRIGVDSGSYIRTLAEEFGRRLGYPASLKGLYRVSIGPYLNQDAYRIEEV
jgi:tRNA pseudouridine55 synthase